MAYSARHRPYLSSSSGSLPPGVKWLLIVNVGVYLLYFFSARFGASAIFDFFGLIPSQFVRGAVWQVATYLFLHDPNGVAHILFNMLALWMFGADLERTWGTKRFLEFYFICGVGAGLCVVVANFLASLANSFTIGASGAIYGLLAAYAVLFPDRTIFFNFLFPIKAKYYALIIGAIILLNSFAAPGGQVSHFAHLGGMVIGYLYLKTKVKTALPSFDLLGSLDQAWKRYKIQRAKKKFEVYLKKQQGPRA